MPHHHPSPRPYPTISLSVAAFVSMLKKVMSNIFNFMLVMVVLVNTFAWPLYFENYDVDASE